MTRFVFGATVLLTAISINAQDLLSGLTRRQLSREKGVMELVESEGRKNVVMSGRIGEKKTDSSFAEQLLLICPISILV